MVEPEYLRFLNVSDWAEMRILGGLLSCNSSGILFLLAAVVPKTDTLSNTFVSSSSRYFRRWLAVCESWRACRRSGEGLGVCSRDGGREKSSFVDSASRSRSKLESGLTSETSGGSDISAIDSSGLRLSPSTDELHDFVGLFHVVLGGK